MSAVSLARQISQGETTAQAVLQQTLDKIERYDARLGCFTTVLAEDARRAAAAVDGQLAAGQSVGPLAGVPFAVKNLFDIAGLTTLAGSKINQGYPPAAQDATAVARLRAAGAVLVGALNMDEYAYGFVTINHHYGPTLNPHDTTRMAGGSSGGSAAAVAADLVPLTLGSDTNGSIRVPAALCGVYGFKPTYGRLSRAGAYLFSSSLDHVGPLGQSVADVALAYQVLHGPDGRDPVCSQRPPEPLSLTGELRGMRLAVADGHFVNGMTSAVAQGLERVVAHLQISQRVTLPETARARAAAYLITASEGAQLHLNRLRTRLEDFDPATCDRFVAGALIPSSWYLQAQRFRRWYRQQVHQLLATVDVIVAPTTPCPAPYLDQTVLQVGEETLPLRPHLGVYTQPLSFIGLPVLSVPVCLPGALPVGIQLIARPHNERAILQVALALEQAGAIGMTPADLS